MLEISDGEKQPALAVISGKKRSTESPNTGIREKLDEAGKKHQ